MPLVWKEMAEVEFWIVGSNPPSDLRALSNHDRRVMVTGFVPQVQDVLKTMTTVLCPWRGTYGFRSRLVEVMALGVPVIASPDAVHGMDMTEGEGIFLRERPAEMALVALQILRDPALAQQQSHRARRQIEQRYGYQTTYQRLAHEIRQFVIHRRG
jgi:glycosyltransferase involved in cell wall biosynthesis